MKKLQIIALSAILAILAVIMITLVLWNNGVFNRSREDDTAQEDFDVEIMDQIYTLSKEQLAGKKDDGKNTILCLGNDSFAFGYDEGLAKALAEETGAEVRNASFPGSTVSVVDRSLDISAHPDDVFSFYYVAKSIAERDFSDIDSVGVIRREENYNFQTSVDTLRDTDYDALDTILIYYDAEDYIKQRSPYNPDEGKTLTDLQTVTGAYASGIRLLKEALPHVRIVMVSPPLMIIYTPEGAPIAADRYDFGHGTLTTYTEFCFSVAEACGVTVLDNYHGMVEEDNANGYLLDDRHLSDAGNAALVKHIARVLAE